MLTSHDGSVDMPMVPKQLLLTSAGQIGVIIEVTDEQLAIDLTGLDRNLSALVEHKTGVSHSK